METYLNIFFTILSIGIVIWLLIRAAHNAHHFRKDMGKSVALIFAFMTVKFIIQILLLTNVFQSSFGKCLDSMWFAVFAFVLLKNDKIFYRREE